MGTAYGVFVESLPDDRGLKRKRLRGGIRDDHMDPKARPRGGHVEATPVELARPFELVPFATLKCPTDMGA